MPTSNGEIHENGKRVAEILSKMRDEFVDFVETRFTMLRTELRDAWTTAKKAIPLVAVAVTFLGTAFLLLTGALVGLVLAAFPNSAYRWFFACLIVGVFWGVIGAAAAQFALRKLKLRNMLPTRTLDVLKNDKVWIDAEVRSRV
jgi:uncharacterized membrane protein YqjE